MEHANWQGIVQLVPPSLWKELFLRSDVSFIQAYRAEWVIALVKEMIGFRFSLEVQDALFETIAIEKGFDPKSAALIWSRIKAFFEIPMLVTPASRMSTLLQISKINLTDFKAGVLDVIAEFVEVRSRIILANVPSGKTADLIRVGYIGELLAFLFSRDLDKAECIYHKLLPDSPRMARHGVDLLAVRLGPSPDNDVVQLWEAKGTAKRIPNARDEIIDWFNVKLASRVDMMIESAKREWRKNYPPSVWRRAVRALCRFQIGRGNYLLVGSVACDPQFQPSEEELTEFQSIRGPPSSKRIVVFSMSEIRRAAEEVFHQACSI